mmetsp:Transcript_9812/g.35954  ORF Transcript_9812/g.35954 Transcript_9812/m.35954 type:complete len:769 (+) Transcript_9812:173-2479(+)
MGFKRSLTSGLASIRRRTQQPLPGDEDDDEVTQPPEQPEQKGKVWKVLRSARESATKGAQRASQIRAKAKQALQRKWQSSKLSAKNLEQMGTLTSYTVPRLDHVRITVYGASGIKARKTEASPGKEDKKKPSVICKLHLCGQTVSTQPVVRTSTPEWGSTFTLLACSPIQDKLIVEIREEFPYLPDAVLGRVEIPLHDVMVRHEVAQTADPKWYFLTTSGGTTSTYEAGAQVQLSIFIDSEYDRLASPEELVANASMSGLCYTPHKRPLLTNAPIICIVQCGPHWFRMVSSTPEGETSSKGAADLPSPRPIEEVLPDTMGTSTMEGLPDHLLPEEVEAKANASEKEVPFSYTFTVPIEVPLYDLASIITVAFFDCTNQTNLLGKVKLRATSFLDGSKKSLRAGVWRVSESSLSGREDFQFGGVLEAKLDIYVDPIAAAISKYFLTGTPRRNFEDPYEGPVREQLIRGREEALVQYFGRQSPDLTASMVQSIVSANDLHFSVRKIRTNYRRIRVCWSDIFGRFGRWFHDVTHWENPSKTVACLSIWQFFVWKPHFLVPFLFFFLAGRMIYNRQFVRMEEGEMMDHWYGSAGVYPTSQAKPGEDLDREDGEGEENSAPDDTAMVVEEDSSEGVEPRQAVGSSVSAVSNTNGSTSSAGVQMSRSMSNPVISLKAKLRSTQGVINNIQNKMGSLVAQFERFVALFNWEDPVASMLFICICCALMTATLLLPPRLYFSIAGFWIMRPPPLRSIVTPPPVTFYRHFPTKSELLF